jgi:hypothetical protein
MPNHVSNSIEFACDVGLAEKIIDEITKEGCVDFETLIPMPLHVYQGDSSKVDDDDFKTNSWYPWSVANWGTKWNAYAGSIQNSNGKVRIYFQTAWSVPYPIIIAFANKYGLEFTHKYYDEGDNFWGVDKWKAGTRVERNYNPEDIHHELYRELLRREWEEEE